MREHPGQSFGGDGTAREPCAGLRAMPAVCRPAPSLKPFPGRPGAPVSAFLTRSPAALTVS